MTSRTADVKELARKWAACVWNRERVAEVATLIHPEHPVGPAGVVVSFTQLHQRLDNVVATVVQQLAEGNRVATMLAISATVNSEPIGWDSIYIHTFCDGKIIDYSAVTNAPEL
jgi:hypothetical protein